MTGDSDEPKDVHSRTARHKMITEAFVPFAKQAWKVDLVWKGNTLPHSIQHDGSSCGPCVLNLLEWLVDEDVPLWNPQRATGYRVSLFLRMAEHAIEGMVSLMTEIPTKC